MRGPLHGIPYAAKDLYATRGIRTTAHSANLRDFIPDFDAACVEQMTAAGAILLGKLSMHEFAFGGPAFDLPFPPARNPHDPEHLPGGSSSGSGVALAAGMCLATLGSDTGGSIRSPAAACGVVGLKPTFGRVSRFGSVGLAPSLDTCGPLAKTVEDCAILLEALAGFDPRDPTTSDVSAYRREAAATRMLRIAVPAELNVLMPKLSDAQSQAHQRAMEVLRAQGHEIVEVALPQPDLMYSVSRAINFAEAYAMHAVRLRTTPENYGHITRERLIMGAFVEAGDYLAAKATQPYLTRLYDRFFGSTDVLMMPAAKGPAGRIDGVRHAPFSGGVEISHGFNVTGHPVLTVPFGTNGKLPLGTQLVSARYGEAQLLATGAVLERADRSVA